MGVPTKPREQRRKSKQSRSKSRVQAAAPSAKSRTTKAPSKRQKRAALADKHDLYERSVQGPEEDAKFFRRYYRKLIGRPARVFREDFCGTAALSTQWVRLHKDHQAIGVDLDAPTLAWGTTHNLAKLKPAQRERIELIRGDVRDVRKPKADIVCALNFSYCVFKTRAELGAYIRNAYRSLAEDGILCVDAWGGPETQATGEEPREVDDFTYIWHQTSFDPVSNHTVCKIHFEFKDGSKLRDAFVYDWRLWTLPELRELFVEAGFRDVHVLWEGTDPKTDEGNGEFRRVEVGESDLAWIAYVVGRR